MKHVLIIWWWVGSNSAPAIPVIVGTYQTEQSCLAAGEAWKISKSKLDWIKSKDATCIPSDN